MAINPGTLTPPVGKPDHVEGPADARVTLVEYGDFECPHCGAAHLIVKAVQKAMGDRLRFVFRHFPLTQIHPHAEAAAEASEAAGAQGQFWAMHDLLFENQHALEDDDLLIYASEIGLDVGRFARELASALYAARVREDYLSGLESGVTGTPTLFINNVRHVGAYDADSLIEAIERVRPLPARPLPGSAVRTQ